jgi:hypothetical protein
MVRHRVADLHGKAGGTTGSYALLSNPGPNLMMSFRRRARHQQALLCRHQIECTLGDVWRTVRPSGVHRDDGCGRMVSVELTVIVHETFLETRLFHRKCLQ